MTPLDWLDSLQGSGIRPGLGRMRALLRALGRPHLAVPAVIVAGTNGKGSTSAALASILTTSGYRTAHYTSPHLVDLRERWTIDGDRIPLALLEASIRDLQSAAARAGIVPTYFEALTLIAFAAFSRVRCEVSVLEVGMGGRLDATNVVRPLAALITPIGIDHTEYLGNTLRKIAGEKAGVIHRDAIVLTNNTDPAVLQVIRRRADKLGCAMHVVDPATAALPEPAPLHGPFQRANLALAIRAAEALSARLPRITGDSIARGVAATRWRGRLERFRVAGREVWVDGCHNLHAIEAVVPFIEERVARPRCLVFGMMSDKNVAEAAHKLFPLFDSVIATEPYPPRSQSAGSIAGIARSMGIRALVEPSPETALRRALDSDVATVFVGGSLYLAGAAIAILDAFPDHGKGEKDR